MQNLNFTQTTQNISEGIKQGGGRKKWLGILGLFLLVLGIPLAVWLLQRTQVFVPKALVEPIELVAGSGSCVVSGDSDKVSCSSFPVKLTSPLGPPVGEGGSCMSDNDCQAGDKCFRYQNYPGSCKPADTACAAVITRACHPLSTCVGNACTQVWGQECADFPSPCQVPPGWTIDNGGLVYNPGTNLYSRKNPLSKIFERLSLVTKVNADDEPVVEPSPSPNFHPPSPSPSTSPSQSPSASPSPPPSVSLSPSPSASSSPSPSASPQGTLYYKMAETEAGLKNAQSFSYSQHPTITNFTFKDAKPGSKQIWVEFIGPNTTSRAEHISVELIEPEPVISSLDCSMDISKKDLVLTLNGTRFGAGSGKVKANDKDAQILSWTENQVTATLKPTENLEDGKLFKVVMTRSDGKSLPETTCLVNTTVISLGAKLFCREPGKFDVSGVKVTLVDQNGNKVNEEVTIDKDGLIKGLKTKLQVGKVYAISIKAPNSLRRNAQFVAFNGTNIITPTEEPNFILPVGDIAPVILPDGKINTLDHSEIVRQWSILGAGSNKTGDFNKDTRVNSIDWACMRYDFNKEDDVVPSAVVIRPSPIPSPSAFVCPTPPICPVGKTLIHGDPSKPGSCTVYRCIDTPAGQRAAYFLLQPEGTGSYNSGQEFNVDLIFWSNEPVNLLVGKLSFDPSVLEVVKIEKGGVINCVTAPCPTLNWTEDSFDNQNGTISLVAGRPSPGLQTTADGSPFAKITFKGKKVGTVNIAVEDASKIYANSDSTNILNTLFSSEIVIK